MECSKCGGCDWTDERIAGRSDTTGEDDVSIGAPELVKHFGNAHAVGDDGQVWDCSEFAGEPPSGGAGHQADRGAAPNELSSCTGNGLLLGCMGIRFGVEAGLVSGVVGRDLGTAVHFDESTGFVEHIEISPDGHVADFEQRGEFGDSDRTACSNFGHDEIVAFLCQRPGNR